MPAWHDLCAVPVEGIGSLRAGVVGDCDPAHRVDLGIETWILMLLITEPSLRSLKILLMIKTLEVCWSRTLPKKLVDKRDMCIFRLNVVTIRTFIHVLIMECSRKHDSHCLQLILNVIKVLGLINHLQNVKKNSLWERWRQTDLVLR